MQQKSTEERRHRRVGTKSTLLGRYILCLTVNRAERQVCLNE